MTVVAVSVTAAPSFPLLISICVSRPLTPGLHLPQALRLSAGVFSPSMNDYFSGKIMQLRWKVLMPPTCVTYIQVSQLHSLLFKPASRRSMGLLCRVYSEDQRLSAC